MAEKGRHEMPKEEKLKKEKTTRVRKREKPLVIALRLVVVLLFALVMLSPLKGCVLSDGGYIDAQTALDAAVRDAGVSPTLVTDTRTDTTSIDGKLCWLVDFSVTGTRHRYVIDAASAEVIAFDP